MPAILIPPPYRGPTGGLERVEAPGETVRACIDAADAAHPGFAAQVFMPSGEPHRFVKLFVNGDAADPDTPVAEGDEIEVLAAIAGG